ncbi:MAG: TetR/AcrR family transcriptional regulator [Massilia sp.]
MVKHTRRTERGETSLSRERIIDASIAMLDAGGEAGLTFRALAEQLATGAGAIYWHVANKEDLLNAASDAIVARTMAACGGKATPQDAIRAISLGMFDVIDAHPWVGAELARSPGKMPMVRILEGLGRQVRLLGVPERGQWQASTTLLHYVLGVASQNASNARSARALDANRADLLGAVGEAWLQLDVNDYAFTRSMAGQLCEHDDRLDFLAGINLFLAGIEAALSQSA